MKLPAEEVHDKIKIYYILFVSCANEPNLDPIFGVKDRKMSAITTTYTRSSPQ